MPIIGNLAEFPLPEVLHFIGQRTGRMKLVDIPGADYMELDLAHGFLRGLQWAGTLVTDRDNVIRHLSLALQVGQGMFEFILLEELYIRGELNLPLQSLAMEMAFAVDTMNQKSEELAHPKTCFVLIQDPQVWLEHEVRQFFHYSREMIQNRSSLREIADFLGMDERVAASHLGKLRALGVVDIAPESRDSGSPPHKRTALIPLPRTIKTQTS